MWRLRAVAIEPVGLNVPVAGSYSSAEARNGPGMFHFPGSPPANRTRPSESRVAVPKPRAVVIEPVAVNVPVCGSYRSANAIGSASK